MIDSLTVTRELTELIKRNGIDTHCNVPAHILNGFLLDLFHSLARTIHERYRWEANESQRRYRAVLDDNPSTGKE